jgi:YggT family protein
MARILAIAIDYFTNVIYILILVRVVLSWLPISRDNAIVRFVYNLTEPLLAPIRGLLDKSPLGGSGMMLDLSPLVLFLIITLVKNILVGFLI